VIPLFPHCNRHINFSLIAPPLRLKNPPAANNLIPILSASYCLGATHNGLSTLTPALPASAFSEISGHHGRFYESKRGVLVFRAMSGSQSRGFLLKVSFFFILLKTLKNTITTFFSPRKSGKSFHFLLVSGFLPARREIRRLLVQTADAHKLSILRMRFFFLKVPTSIYRIPTPPPNLERLPKTRPNRPRLPTSQGRKFGHPGGRFRVVWLPAAFPKM